MRRTYVVGLTGGIGSGKSAVSREFERLSVPVVDADIIAREVVEPGSEGLAEVVAHFGDSILASDGNIDRKALREIVFQSDEQRLVLEGILHPKIRDRTRALLDAVETPYCILSVPLMVERGGNHDIDRLLVVDCPTELQISRVMERDQLTQPQVEAIMQRQASREDRLKVADDIVENTGSLTALTDAVQTLHERYLKAAKQHLDERESNAEQPDGRAKHPVS